MNDLTNPTNQTADPLHSLIDGELTLGDPDVAGPLTVFPIFGPDPKLDYSSFAHAREQGATIGELKGGASVRDLVIDNPTPLPVLLFEGEEVLGAQQNRTFDTTVLVGAGKSTQIPVSCVEQGRWDGRRRQESFRESPQTAHPELRRGKSRQVRKRVRAGATAHADQGQVWNDISEIAGRHNIHSRTEALSDVFEGRRSALNEMQHAIRVRDGQVGALVAIGGRIVVLDWVSRPSVFADLHAPLVQGYALDALEGAEDDCPERR